MQGVGTHRTCTTQNCLVNLIVVSKTDGTDYREGTRRSVEPTGGTQVAGSEKYVTQQEAADLADVSYDTIRRWRAAEKFPNARHRQDCNATWEIPLSDLVAVGLTVANLPDRDVHERLGRTPLERELRETRGRLVHAEAHIKMLEAINKSHAGEIDFIRKLVKAAA